MPQRLIQEILEFAIDRKQFGEPSANHQLVQAILADSRAGACAARCMVEHTPRG